jgi:hypothetical protein
MLTFPFPSYAEQLGAFSPSFSQRTVHQLTELTPKGVGVSKVWSWWSSSVFEKEKSQSLWIHLLTNPKGSLVTDPLSTGAGHQFESLAARPVRALAELWLRLR